MQAIYYLLSGIWPLIHLASFESVTGPKVEVWLVRTVGVVTVAIGGALAAGVRRRTPALETLVLAMFAAAAYGSIDFVYGLTGRIRFVYVIDGCAQTAIVFAVVAQLVQLHGRPAA